MRAGKFLIGCSVAAALVSINAAQADVVISKKPTANMSCSAGVCSPTASKAVLNATDLANMLAGGDVTVKTGSGATNIVVKDSFTWTSTARLTLDAIQSVEFDKPVTVAGTGAVTITTNDGGSGGDLLFGDKGSLTFWDTNSSLIINGNSYTLVNDIATLASDIAANPSGFYALANDYDASQDGTYNTSPVTTALAGVFDGLGNAILNLSIAFPGGDNDGLFRDIEAGGRVSNIKVIDATLKGTTLRGEYGGAGVLAGANYGIVGHAFASGTITLPLGDNELPGGLVGGNEGIVTDSHANVRVYAGDAAFPAVGGLIGLNDGSVSASYATGKARAVGGATAPGGLVGYNRGQITNTYSLAAVGETGPDAGGYYGGLVGKNLSTGQIANSYAAGVIRPGRKKLRRTPGGLVGFDAAAPGQISNSYWDIEKGVSDPSDGAGNVANDPGIKGLTTRHLQSSLPRGFSRKIWGLDPKINKGYPFLLAVKPQ